MSEKINNQTGELIAAKSFSYRGIKKEFTTFEAPEVITSDFHLELGENNESVIIEDRKVDWAELANKDVDSVGLRHVLENLARQGQSVKDVMRNKTFSFDNSEAIDTSMIDPENPDSIKVLQKQNNEAQSKIDAIAAQLGVSSDKLVKMFSEGKLSDLIAAKAEADKTAEGGNK